jgi:hypothetical protein
MMMLGIKAETFRFSRRAIHPQVIAEDGWMSNKKTGQL